MTTPHLAAVLARTQRSLMAQSHGEAEKLRAGLTAELAHNAARLAGAADGPGYVALTQEKGRLQDALASLG